MSMTREASQWHERYENAPPVMNATVNEAYTAARKVLEQAGYSCSNRDPAEELVAAIMKYLTESAEEG